MVLKHYNNPMQFIAFIASFELSVSGFLMSNKFHKFSILMLKAQKFKVQN